MIDTLKKALEHMQSNELPCSEVKLAIFLLEKEAKCTK
jgi:hypothetical protein